MIFITLVLTIYPQVLLAALYKCQKQAYDSSGTDIIFKEWVDEICDSSDMFFYWTMIMRFQSLFLAFIRSIREGNWNLNVSTRMMLMKYVFVFDRTNYSRWMSVDLHDDQQLPTVCPTTFENHLKGQFTKTVTGNLVRTLG